MAIAAAIAAAAVEVVVSDKSKLKSIPFTAYAKAAATCALASPMGYASLKYISFPMHILVKSSKPGESSYNLSDRTCVADNFISIVSLLFVMTYAQFP